METKYYKVIQVKQDETVKVHNQTFFIGQEVWYLSDDLGNTDARSWKVEGVRGGYGHGQQLHNLSRSNGANRNEFTKVLYGSKQELFEAMMKRLSKLQEEIVENFTKEVD